eukprot:9552902-Alexandrium_andersonii.AAC.1
MSGGGPAGRQALHGRRQADRNRHVIEAVAFGIVEGPATEPNRLVVGGQPKRPGPLGRRGGPEPKAGAVRVDPSGHVQRLLLAPLIQLPANDEPPSRAQ